MDFRDDHFGGECQRPVSKGRAQFSYLLVFFAPLVTFDVTAFDGRAFGTGSLADSEE